MPFGSHLTGYTGDVTIEARPSSMTLAGVGGPLLPTGASVLTGGGVTPAHQVL